MKNTLFILISLSFNISLYSQGLNLKQPIKYLALGDSYTIGESVKYAERWPSILFDSLKSLGYETDTIQYIAKTGWRTDNLINAIKTSNVDSSYTLVSLLIGVNNQYQNYSIDKYKREFPLLIKQAIALAHSDTNSVFVLSIPDYAYTPFGNEDPSITRELSEYDKFAKTTCDSFNINFYNITPISQEGIKDPSLVANDRLHPSGKQYKKYVDLILSYPINNLTNITYLKNKRKLSLPNPTTLDNLILNIPNHIIEWYLIDLSGKVIADHNRKRTAYTKNQKYILRIVDKDSLIFNEEIILK